MSRFVAHFLLAAGVLSVQACSGEIAELPAVEEHGCSSAVCAFSFFFESGLDRWRGQGGGSLTASSGRAAAGAMSADLAVEGLGFGWLAGLFSLRPKAAYDLEVVAAYCCLDYSADVVGPDLLVGAGAKALAHTDLTRFRRDAGDDSTIAVGTNVWRYKRFNLRANSNPDGRIAVGLGILATFEGLVQFLHIDNLRLTFTAVGPQ